MAVLASSLRADLNRRLGECAGLVDAGALLARAARLSSLPLQDLAVLADADLQTITPRQYDKVLDVAEADGLERILQSLDPLALRRIGVDADPAAVAALYRPRAEARRAYVKQAYGVGLPRLVGGVFSHDFAQRGDDTSGF